MARIEKRKDTYRFTVSNGYDNEGKQIRETMTWKAPSGMSEKKAQKEAERQAILFEERIRNGTYITGNVKFSEFSERWLKEYATKHLTPNTLSNYQHLLLRINKCLGHLHLDKIQPHHLNAFYNELNKPGIRADTKYRAKVDLMLYLKEHKLTKTKLSELSGVGITTLDSITNNKNIAKTTAEKVSSALSESLTTLFEPVNSDKTLSSKTIKEHHTLISSILSTAVQWQIIAANPCDRIKAPKVEHHEAKHLEKSDIALLLNTLDEKSDIQHKAMIYLLLSVGMRRGELLALKWSDVDFEKSLLNISHSLNYTAEKGLYEGLPKTESSIRVVKLSNNTMEMLKKYKAWQSEQRLKVGDLWHDEQWIFTRYDGQVYRPDTLTNWFEKFIKNNNLKKITIHGLRHTNASILIAEHTPLTTVAGRLGHASTATTTKIYAHEIQSASEAATEVIEDFLTSATIQKKA